MISALSSTPVVSPPARPAAELPAQRQEVSSAASPTPLPQPAVQAEGRESTVVTISEQASRPAAAEAAPAPAPTPAPAATGASEPPVSSKPELAYEAADVDKDGEVSVLEQQVYDFRNPALAAARAEANRVASSDLRAYEAVARAGRIV